MSEAAMRCAGSGGRAPRAGRADVDLRRERPTPAAEDGLDPLRALCTAAWSAMDGAGDPATAMPAASRGRSERSDDEGVAVLGELDLE